MRFKVKARIASKVREKDLLEKAKMLMDDPELILPECTEDCGSCPFRKTKARLEKIQRFKDNQAKLARFAKSGDKLARAYAATIGLVHEEKTPYLGSATYPAGTITFVLRGKTAKEKLIGVQNFDSPKWRVLSVLDLVQKKGLHFYSYGDHFICTGKYARPPLEYVKLAAEAAGAAKAIGDDYECPHDPKTIDHLLFDWTTAGKKILLCDQCAIKNKNTLKKLAEGMAVPKALSEFAINVVRPLKSVSGKDDCANLLNMATDDGLLEEYSNGKIGDAELIVRHMEDVREALSKMTNKAYIRGDKCFGDDIESFARDLTLDDIEMRSVIGLLSNVDHPVIVDSQDSVNKILSAYWQDHGMDALRAVVSENLAEKHYRNDPESSKSPLKIIHEALSEARHEEVSSKIPKYSCLSQYSDFADKVVRAYKTKGVAGAIAVLDTDKSNDHRIRSMSNAFYLALGDHTKSWKFKGEEKEYGKHLETFARRLLESEGPEGHHEAFETFLREAGCSEDLKKI